MATFLTADINSGHTIRIAQRAAVNYTLTVNEVTVDNEGVQTSVAAFNLTGATVVFTVASRANAALIVKSSTVSAQLEILTQSGATLGQATLKFIGADTASLVVGTPYFYDCWVYKVDAQVVQVIPVRTFRVLAQVGTPDTTPPAAPVSPPTSITDLTAETINVTNLLVGGEKIYGGEIDVREFGADVAGGLTCGQRAQKIQDAIDSAASRTYKPTVVIPGNHTTPWDLGRRNTTPGDAAVKSALEMKSGVNVRGHGQGRTVLRLCAGDYTAGGDLYFVRALNTNRFTLSNLTIDGNDPNCSGDAQTHNFQFQGTCNEAALVNITSTGAIGDGIRIIGTDASNQVKKCVVRNSIIHMCGRSGVAVQSFVQVFWLFDNLIYNIPAGGLLDMEPSGAGAEQFLISRNLFDSLGDSAISVSLSGGTSDGIESVFKDNIVRGSVEGNALSRVRFVNNEVICTVSGKYGVDFTRVSDAKIEGCYVSNVGQFAIHIGQRNSVLAERCHISKTTTSNANSGILFEDVKDCSIRQCDIIRTGSQAGIGVSVQSIIGGQRNVSIKDNFFSNWGEGIHVGGTTNAAMDGIEVDPNSYSGCGHNVRFEASGAGQITNVRMGPQYGVGNTSPQYTGLEFAEPIICGGLGYTTGSGAGQKAVVYLHGMVDPRSPGVAAPIGSVYTRDNGQLFRKLSTGNTGWTELPSVRTVTAGITASTTQTQAGGVALTAEVNEVSVCANANDAVTLPSAIAGLPCLVINNGAQTVQVFPASGDNLGAGVDTSTTIVAGSRKLFQAYDTTNWEPVL